MPSPTHVPRGRSARTGLGVSESARQSGMRAEPSRARRLPGRGSDLERTVELCSSGRAASGTSTTEVQREGSGGPDRTAGRRQEGAPHLLCASEHWHAVLAFLVLPRRLPRAQRIPHLRVWKEACMCVRSASLPGEHAFGSPGAGLQRGLPQPAHAGQRASARVQAHFPEVRTTAASSHPPQPAAARTETTSGLHLPRSVV